MKLILALLRPTVIVLGSTQRTLTVGESVTVRLTS